MKYRFYYQEPSGRYHRENSSFPDSVDWKDEQVKFEAADDEDAIWWVINFIARKCHSVVCGGKIYRGRSLRLIEYHEREVPLEGDFEQRTKAA